MTWQSAPQLLTICIYIYLVLELLSTRSFPLCSFVNHSRTSMPRVAEFPGRKKIKFCTGDKPHYVPGVISSSNRRVPGLFPWGKGDR